MCVSRCLAWAGGEVEDYKPEFGRWVSHDLHYIVVGGVAKSLAQVVEGFVKRIEGISCYC